jgi:hypothetical protein
MYGDHYSTGNSRVPQIDLSLRGSGGYNPLSELMRAIILRVIDDYNSKGELREEAIVYLEDTEEEYIFSFISICTHFNIDPCKTKSKIMNAEHKIRTRRRAS